MTATLEQKKAFALEQIKPYFKDPSLCGYEEDKCAYIATNGNMCVVGKNMLSPQEWSQDEPVCMILDDHTQEDVLKPSTVGILSDKEWFALQRVHDAIAMPAVFSLNEAISNLGLFTMEELES